MGDPDREIAPADGDTPSPAPEAEIEFAPYRETAQGNLGQPGSATDLLTFAHGTPPVFKTARLSCTRTRREKHVKTVSPQVAKVNRAAVGAAASNDAQQEVTPPGARIGSSAYEPPCGVVPGRKRLTLSALTTVAT